MTHTPSCYIINKIQMLKVPIQPKDFPYLASRSPEVYEGDQLFASVHQQHYCLILQQNYGTEPLCVKLSNNCGSAVYGISCENEIIRDPVWSIATVMSIFPVRPHKGSKILPHKSKYSCSFELFELFLLSMHLGSCTRNLIFASSFKCWGGRPFNNNNPSYCTTTTFFGGQIMLYYWDGSTESVRLCS